jgi:uncharacterized protein (TIGR03435 family)
VLKSSLPFWLVVTAVSAFAQRPAEALLRFDVVAIKPNNSGEFWSSQSPIRDKVGRYNARNASLKSLIMWSYGVSEAQISGGPRWLGTDRFDVDAQVDGQPGKEQVAEMVRTLLSDRFQLQLHFEARDIPRYTLLAPKNGLTFGPHLAKADDRDCSAEPGGAQGCRAAVGGSGHMEMEHVTFAVVAVNLSSMLGMPVVNETQLDGRYDIKLDLTPPEVTSPASFGDTVMDALREQLGLRLELRKVPGRSLVIDRAEKPTGN